MSTGKALMILLAVVLVVAAYLGLTGWLGIHEHWAGFLFLLQWSMMEHMAPDKLPKSALGATFGAAIPFIPVWLAPAIGGGAALGVMLAVILVAVFLLIRQAATLLVNAATMIFLTVVAVPHIAERASPADLFLGLWSGVIFFGGLAGIAALIRSRRPAARPAHAAS